MSRFSRGIVAVGVLAALTFGLSPAKALKPPTLDHTVLCSPDQEFSLTIDNPYAPLRPGQRSVLVGLDDGEHLGVQITVLKETESLYNGAVVTRVVKELEWEDVDLDGRQDRDEDLIEISLNYFAQVASGPNAGTVCYFGEEVDIYDEDGDVVSNEGRWRADEGDNAPGIFMPAEPEVGQSFFTEAAPGIAEDMATIEDFTVHTVPAGTFQEAMEITDCSTVDRPVDCGTKFYGLGVGLIEDNDVQLIKFTSPGKK